MRVCDFIIFEIPILTVEIIYVVDHTTVKIGISNIIKSQTLTISSPCLGSFFRIPILLFEINNFLYLLSIFKICKLHKMPY